jgi:hypothetical protein
VTVSLLHDSQPPRTCPTSRWWDRVLSSSTLLLLLLLLHYTVNYHLWALYTTKGNNVLYSYCYYCGNLRGRRDSVNYDLYVTTSNATL